MRIRYTAGTEMRHVDVPSDALAALVAQMEALQSPPPHPAAGEQTDSPVSQTSPTKVWSGRVYSKIANRSYMTTIVADSVVTMRYREGGVDHFVTLPPDVFRIVDTAYRRQIGDSPKSEAEIFFDPDSGTVVLGFIRGFDYRIILAVIAVILGAIVAIIVRLSVWRVKRERDELLASRRHMAQIRENERSHLASELHDGPIQDLQRILRTYVGQLSSLSADEQKAKLAEIEFDLRDVAGNLRGICSDLKPPVLVHFGLARAVEALTRDFQARHPHLRVDLEMGPDPDVLKMEIRLVVYRILQEALTNIEKHAAADYVRVSLQRVGNTVELVVKDNGQGLRVPSRLMKFEHSGHFGLSGMLQRAQAVGGRLDVSSRPGDGTRISVEVPYIHETVVREPTAVEESA